jgi:hypothetical protein
LNLQEASLILPARIFRSIELDPVKHCWLWQRSLEWTGYGRSYYEGKQWKVHRLVYTLLVGDIPEKLDLDHLCRVRHCVNPSHLEPVTRAENILRGDLPGRMKTHCKHGHELTPENTVRYNGRRSCRTCRLEANRQWYHRDEAHAQDLARISQAKQRRSHHGP